MGFENKSYNKYSSPAPCHLKHVILTCVVANLLWQSTLQNYSLLLYKGFIIHNTRSMSKGYWLYHFRLCWSVSWWSGSLFAKAKYRSLYSHAVKCKMCKTSFIRCKLETIIKENRHSTKTFFLGLLELGLTVRILYFPESICVCLGVRSYLFFIIYWVQTCRLFTEFFLTFLKLLLRGVLKEF